MSAEIDHLMAKFSAARYKSAQNGFPNYDDILRDLAPPEEETTVGSVARDVGLGAGGALAGSGLAGLGFDIIDRQKFTSGNLPKQPLSLAKNYYIGLQRAAQGGAAPSGRLSNVSIQGKTKPGAPSDLQNRVLRSGPQVLQLQQDLAAGRVRGPFIPTPQPVPEFTPDFGPKAKVPVGMIANPQDANRVLQSYVKQWGPSAFGAPFPPNEMPSAGTTDQITAAAQNLARSSRTNVPVHGAQAVIADTPTGASVRLPLTRNMRNPVYALVDRALMGRRALNPANTTPGPNPAAKSLGRGAVGTLGGIAGMFAVPMIGRAVSGYGQNPTPPGTGVAAPNAVQYWNKQNAR